MKKMLVIDGNSILNRAYYGIRPLTNKNGLYTHAVYGMINIISRHVESMSPDYCVVAFDLKAPTFRHNMYSEYKANRKGMPEELAVQLPYAKKCMECLGYRVLTCEGYEADDLLGTLSRAAGEESVHAYVLTGDRDSLQLINDNVSVLLVKTKETIEFDRNVFFQTYGVYPEVFVDVKALMGDSSDNIPGVAGIGEKTAFKLISDFGDMDSLYEKYEESALSASIKQKLHNGRDMAFLSRDLARIDTHAPIDTSLCESEYNGPKKQELYNLFAELEFSALIKKFGLEGMQSSLVQSEIESGDKKELVKIGIDEIDSLKGRTVAVSLEDGVVSLCDGEKWLEESVDAIGNALDGVRIVCHDYKSVYKDFCNRKLKIGECAFDTMLAAYVLNSNRSKYELDDVLVAYLGANDSGLTRAADVFALYETLKSKVKEQNCESLLFDIEIPLAKVLGDMELVGFKIDVEGVKRYGEELSKMAEALKSRIYSIAGEEFNINSPKQLGEILFEKMGLPKSKKTKTGYSTDAETLQKLSSKHGIIEDILDYRQVSKLKSTYAEGLVKAADDSGRIHTVFNQTGTATGRLSSAEPNLQNIPIKTELGRKFRKYFVPSDEGRVIIDADYSQIELRLLAHISDDDNMKAAFLRGDDIHTATASTVFGVSPDMVTTELRKRAKAVNFGIVYGIGEHSLSEDLGISRKEAKAYIDSYLAGFPSVCRYLDGIKQKAREDGYVVTEFGRKRYIPEITASNKNVQHFGERVAMNSPIQGTAADVIKIAMIKVADELKKTGTDAKLILQVHDELLVEANLEDAPRIKRLLAECMMSAADFSVPLDVEANIGSTWFDAK